MSISEAITAFIRDCSDADLAAMLTEVQDEIADRAEVDRDNEPLDSDELAAFDKLHVVRNA
jgi:hypothetical protein